MDTTRPNDEWGLMMYPNTEITGKLSVTGEVESSEL